MSEPAPTEVPRNSSWDCPSGTTTMPTPGVTTEALLTLMAKLKDVPVSPKQEYFFDEVTRKPICRIDHQFFGPSHAAFATQELADAFARTVPANLCTVAVDPNLPTIEEVQILKIIERGKLLTMPLFSGVFSESGPAGNTG